MIVIVPNRVKFDIEKEIIDSYPDIENIKILHVRYLVDDYSDRSKLSKLEEIMKKTASEAVILAGDDEDIYLVATGSSFHVALMSKILNEMGIPYKILVYERKQRRYVEYE